MSETDYERGYKAAYRHLLRECVLELGGSETKRHGWLVERAEAIAALRSVCSEHGDNDWPDDLHLADIIVKHLRRHL